jgi:hypothetical protein
MAGAPLIVTDRTADAPVHYGVFADLKFFLAQRLPSRSHYIQQITSNGGQIVKVEGNADHLICDHLRADAPSGGVSYQWIDETLKSGQLLDTGAYTVAKLPRPSASRVSTATKSTRTPFTTEDDKVLLDWVDRAEAAGDAVRGNAIYEALAALNPRHTAQAWRSRYVKNLVHVHPRESMVSSTAPQGVSHTTNQKGKPQGRQSASVKASQTSAKPNLHFDQDDFDQLLASVEDILEIPDSQSGLAWQEWAEAHGQHTAKEWQTFFNRQVLPEYIRRGCEAQHISMTDDRAVPEKSGSKRRRSSIASERGSGRSRPRLEVTHAVDSAIKDESTAMLEPGSENQTLENVASVPTAARARSGKLQDDILITSDENQAADMQLTVEMNGSGPIATEVVASDTDDVVSTVRDGTNNGSLAARGIKNLGDALTEANLAVQQAHHQAQLCGMDLHEDDKADDKSEFIDYLQNVAVQAKATTEGQTDGPRLNANDPPTDRVSADDEHSSLPHLPRIESNAHQGAIATDTNEPLSTDQPRTGESLDGSRSINDGDHIEVDLNLDLTIPEAAGGFFLGSTPAQSSQLTTASQKLEPVETFFGTRTLDTQDIFGAATQNVDTTIPEPVQIVSGTDEDQETPKAKLTNRKSLSAHHDDELQLSESGESDVDMESWMKRMAQDGHKDASIIEALKCTSMRPHLAEYVLLNTKHGKGLPRDVPGVWSESDDRTLQGSDARQLRALEEKHGGWSELEYRRDFLEKF